MDALDEFFHLWSEPEAWCQRCEEYPAMHVAVYDKTAPEGLIITYVRIWDARLHDHVALCRRCSRLHINSLGRQPSRYLPPVRYAIPAGWQQWLLNPPPLWWQYVALWYHRLHFWLRHAWRSTPRSAVRPGTKRYTGTSSNN
jgi:hypothetical protein